MGAETTLSRTYGDIYTSTLDEVLSDVHDAVIEASPAIDFFNKEGLSKESTGPLVEIPIRSSKNVATTWINQGEDMSTDTADILTIGTQTRRYLTSTVQMDVIDEAINAAGETRRLDLFAERINTSIDTQQESWADAMWLFAAGQGGRQPDPFPLSMIDNVSAATTFEGLDPSASTFWRPERIASTATTRTGLLQEFHRLFNRIRRHAGVGNRFWGMMDDTLWETVVSGGWDKVQIINPKNTSITYGFEGIEIVGGLRMMHDFRVPDASNQLPSSSGTASTLYISSNEAHHFEYLKGMKLRRLEPRWNGKKTIRIWPMIMAVNLVNKARRYTGSLSGASQTITAA